jgi:hypothetical protein
VRKRKTKQKLSKFPYSRGKKKNKAFLLARWKAKTQIAFYLKKGKR